MRRCGIFRFLVQRETYASAILAFFFLLLITTHASVVTGAATEMPAGLASAAAQSAATGDVVGRVLSATDARPMAGLTLRLKLKVAVTDAKGYFQFRDIPSGYQLITFDHESLKRAKTRKARTCTPIQSSLMCSLRSSTKCRTRPTSWKPVPSSIRSLPAKPQRSSRRISPT